jgi:hypothetical protein
MSCNGNRFSCGMKRFDKHISYDNTPSNVQLHNESDKRLQEMLNIRALQDKGVFTPLQTNMTQPSQPSQPSQFSDINHGKTS